jgi:hypothetical protein
MRFFGAEKILPLFYRLREIHKKQKNSKKNPYFWLPHQQIGSMTGTFAMPEFQQS